MNGEEEAMQEEEDCCSLQILQQESEAIELDFQDVKDGNFCFSYYLARYRDLRVSIIKEIFRDLTKKWNRNFVIYPLSSCEDIELMM